MECKHERIRCTDGIFYCLLCGARIDYPPKGEEVAGAKEKPVKTAKKAAKQKESRK